MGKPVSRSSGSLGTLSIGGKVIANVSSIRIEPMSSDNTDRLMRDLECLIDSDWGQDDDEVGFVPPARPATRAVAVAQSSGQTARNVWAAQAALEAMQQMTGSGTNQPAGVITAGSKPKQEPPKIDKPRKRKVTLE